MEVRVSYPSVPLRRYVRYYYVLTCREPECALTFPIGCPQIIFHKGEPLFIPELSVTQSQFTVSGQVNFPAHVVSGGDTMMVVAVFFPHTIGIFIDTPPSAFYNMEISGQELGDRALNELAARVQDMESAEECVELIDRWLMSRLNRVDKSPYTNRIDDAVRSLMADPSLPVERLASRCCVSSKQFGRIFNNHVGMMPKEYARIVRFQKSLWMMQNRCDDYAAIACACSYSDQSHFIREFRQFSGMTPKQLAEYQTPYSDLYTVPV